MIQLALHVGVEQRHVAFPAAPEYIALAAEFMRDFHGLLHLRRGKGKHIGVAACACAVDETRVGKQIRRAPEQFDSGAFLFRFSTLTTASRFLLVSRRFLPSGATSRS